MWRNNPQTLKTKTKVKEHQLDTSLLGAFGVLILFGLVMLFSASSVVSYAKFGNTYHYLFSQILSLGIGSIFFLIFLKVDYHYYKKFSTLFLVFSFLLLVAVFIPGLQANYGTARSWIVIFGHSFQTSELVKIFLLLYLATWLENKQGDLGSFKEVVIPFLGLLAVLGVLMAAQPNLGTLFIIVSILLAVFFIGGARLSHFLFIIFVGILGLLFLLYLPHHFSHSHQGKSSYQLRRFECLNNLDYSSQDACYQVNQSLIAVGSGGILGRGLGKSRQKHAYLPEVWADSIFPIIAEETGFVFSAFLIVLYLFIFYRGLLIARAAPDLYGTMIATGIVVWFAVESFLNIGGMINLIPMTGVPLPFISAGGSAIFSSLIALGILLNISKQTKEYDRYQSRQKIR